MAAYANQDGTHFPAMVIQTIHRFELQAADGAGDVHTLSTLAPCRESMMQLFLVVLAIHVTFLAVEVMTTDFVSLHQLLSRKREPTVLICALDVAVFATAAGLHSCW